VLKADLSPYESSETKKHQSLQLMFL